MAIMQYDGNFMIYKGRNRFNRKPLWTSNTNVKGDYFMFQNDAI